MDTKQFSKCELELAPYSLRLLKLVGAIGFEPTTPCAQGRCATRLRYAPTVIRNYK